MAFNKQVVDVQMIQALQAIRGFTFMRQQGADKVYQQGSTYVRISPLPGGRARMTVSQGSCDC